MPRNHVLLIPVALIVASGATTAHSPPLAADDVTAFDAATGKRLGHLVTDSWPAPFLIRERLLIWYTPSVVRVADFASGKTLFGHAVRSLAYRGPYPPGAARP